MQDGGTVEVGVIGKDGVVGLPILLGGDGMPGKTFIQVEGSGFRINAKRLKEEFERSGELETFSGGSGRVWICRAKGIVCYCQLTSSRVCRWRGDARTVASCSRAP